MRTTQLAGRLFQAARRAYFSRAFLWLLIGLGVVLRLVQYLSNRSLWMDESFLALNIVGRSFRELLLPLDYGQGAPVGFLLAEKLALQVLGNSEYTLRLIPLLAGIVAEVLFLIVARRFVSSAGLPIAVGLFAIGDPLIYYASEVKQYSTDVAIALLLFWALMDLRTRRLTIPRILFISALGVLAIWFSHPAVFMLAGVGGSLLAYTMFKRDWAQVSRFAVACCFWILGFAICYGVSLRYLRGNDMLLDFWSGGFMPLPPRSYADLRWFADAFFRLFADPVGVQMAGLAGLAFLIGLITMAAKQRWSALLLCSPLLVTLLVSGFHVYPFSSRLILFLAPFVLLILAEGVDWVWRVSTSPRLVPIVLVGLLLYHPVVTAGDRLLMPRTREEIAPVLDCIAANRAAGDKLYLYYGAQFAFKYYQEQYGFGEGDYIVGVESRDDWQRYVDDLDSLRGSPRVWVLFSHFTMQRDEMRFFLFQLDTIGKRLAVCAGEGAAAYLYDLSQ